MGDGISVWRGNLLLNAVNAGASIVRPRTVASLTARISATKAVGAAEAAAHKKLGIKRKDAKVARPFLLGCLLLLLVDRGIGSPASSA